MQVWILKALPQNLSTKKKHVHVNQVTDMSEKGLAIPGDLGIWIQALSIPAPESIKAPSVVLEGYGGE